ncbi:thioesterase domain-containing protein [Nannocystis pusilla]|uniref:thioesterase domain-containing protein n=1 Tax=Nannocystis pusilla TaxID=889268 RepID=UPI003DA3B533
MLTEVVQHEVAVVVARSPAEVATNRPLQQLGMDSLMAVALRGQLTRVSGRPISTEVIFRQETCAGIASHLLHDLQLAPRAAAGDDPDAALVQEALARIEQASVTDLRAAGLLEALRQFVRAPAPGRAESPWLRVLKPARAPRARIFCFSGMGGATSGHVPLVPHLPDNVELVAIQLTAREARRSEPPIVDMPELVAHVAGAIAPLLDAPTLLYGHCQGSWLALEVAHRVRERVGLPPLGLVVATGLPAEAELTAAIRELAPLTTRWHDTPACALAPAFAGVLPDALLANEELFAEYLQACDGDLALGENYRRWLQGLRRNVLDVPITAVSGTRDPLVPAQRMDEWRMHTRGRFVRHSIDGTHAAPMENPLAMAAELLRALTALEFADAEPRMGETAS